MNTTTLVRTLSIVALTVVTAIVLVPIAAVVFLAMKAPAGTGGGPLASLTLVLTRTQAPLWLWNSFLTSGIATLIVVMVAAPAGYVLARSRSWLASGYSLTLFIVQTFPTVIFIVPLFVLFARLQLADTLVGVIIVYVAVTIPVACWMMASYMSSIPETLEEAAWIDGTSRIGGFFRIVLRNSLPGILSTAIFAFLMAWNDYLVALVFLRSDTSFTLPIGLQTFFQQNTTDWGPVMVMGVLMMLPPILVFAFLQRHFSIGGIAGALSSQ